MKYTDAEIAFLLAGRTVEARGGKWLFKEVVDFRQLGGRGVDVVFENMLDRRCAGRSCPGSTGDGNCGKRC